MLDFLTKTLGIAYWAFGCLTGGYLVLVYGPKLLQYLASNLPKTVEEWLLFPLILLFCLFLGTMGLGVAMIAWPLTWTILVAEKKRKRREVLEARTEEYEGLLGEIREDQQ